MPSYAYTCFCMCALYLTFSQANGLVVQMCSEKIELFGFLFQILNRNRIWTTLKDLKIQDVLKYEKRLKSIKGPR
jgi:hypothetical protein